MNDIKNVCEMRFGDLSPAVILKVAEALQNALNEIGLSPDEYQMCVHPVAEIGLWKALTDPELPSVRQAQYLKNLLLDLASQLKIAIANQKDVGHPATILRVARDIANSGDLTRKRAGELIDAVKEALDDIKFLLEGRTASPD